MSQITENPVKVLYATYLTLNLFHLYARLLSKVPLFYCLVGGVDLHGLLFHECVSGWNISESYHWV